MRLKIGACDGGDTLHVLYRGSVADLPGRPNLEISPWKFEGCVLGKER